MNFNLMKNKNLSFLMFSKLISLAGTQMQDFALSLYVLKKTGSATLFASVLIVALIPQLLLSPIAGVFADWLDRIKIIIYLDVISSVLVSIFAAVYMVSGGLSMTAIYALVITLTLASSLYQPAIGTIIPTIVDKENLVDANGINSLVMNLGNLVAPLLAGILFGFYGLFAILLINAVSFLLSAIVEVFINIPKINKMPAKISFKAFNEDFKEGIQFVKERQLLLYIIILAPILNFVFSPLFSTGITFISKKLFKISDFQYGLMQMIIVSAMLVAPFVTSKYAKKLSLSKLIFFGFFICSMLIAMMAIIPSPLFLKLFKGNLVPFISLTVMSFLTALIITTANIAISSMFQKIVPVEMLGRVGTVMGTACMAIMPLGLIFFGILFDSMSAWLCVLICSIILFVTILIFRKPLLNYTEAADKGVNPLEELEII